MTTAHPNELLLRRFYDGFRRRDAICLASAYHREARFTDPIFDLSGAEIGGMWHLLLARARDLEVTYRDVRADDERGEAAWEARYSFGSSRRKVHNVVRATFEFRDGLIVRHTDDFDFRAWSRQALGLSGLVLGGTPTLKKQVSRRAARELARYLDERREASLR